MNVLHTEEKGTDVNIATHLLVDGFRDSYDMAAVLSNDSDLAHTIATVRAELKKPVVVLCPCTKKKTAFELKKVASYVKEIRSAALAACQFDPSLADTHGKITKPESW